MSALLSKNHYGKGAVRVLKRTQEEGRDKLTEITAEIHLEGDFVEAYKEGDNRRVVATDTMKNTVYALAKDHLADPIEPFAMYLSGHFLDRYEQVARVRVSLEESVWHNMSVGTGLAHPHAFMAAGQERRTCRVNRTRDAIAFDAGLANLRILKTTQSGFADFHRDEYTTLAETDDRILGTDLGATWRYRSPEVDYAACRRSIRFALLSTFANHDSLSVQHTLYAMAETALADCSDITEIHLSMPNKHRLLVNLTPFDLENDKEIFMPVDKPYGIIEATVRRA